MLLQFTVHFFKKWSVISSNNKREIKSIQYNYLEILQWIMKSQSSCTNDAGIVQVLQMLWSPTEAVYMKANTSYVKTYLEINPILIQD